MNKKTKTIFSCFVLSVVMFLYAMPFVAYATGAENTADTTQVTEVAEIAETAETAEGEVAIEAPEAAAETEEATEEAAEEEAAPQSKYYGTWLSLLPPIIAIALALITKEVYSSLFVGIIAGAFISSNFNIVNTLTSIFSVMTAKLGDEWNIGILVFLIILGIMVAVINKAGGSAAYGKWASNKIKSKSGAMLSTVGLGVLIFIDDYFNCLTVGSVMRSVTDKFKISRAKLAYIIDATAAPICIIAPISSWAAAVTSSTEGTAIDGFKMFIQAIPYNFYALLTIFMLIMLAALKFDFGPMKMQEALAESGDLFGGYDKTSDTKQTASQTGKVIDLIIPVFVLIISCIIGILYTGDFFKGTSFTQAFIDCDASKGLVLGSFVALVITFLLYIPRKVLSFKDFTDSIPEGFKSMVAPILILAFAWTLSGFCRDNLGAGNFVEVIVDTHKSASVFLPAAMFLIALGLAFATGTSWGTFAILIPIVIDLFPAMSEILVISISACLAGAVCGDHISPISDTTIMASAGAECNHINHVSTQIPYALTVAAVSFVCYIIAGIVQNIFIVLPIAFALMLAILLVIKKMSK